MRFRTPGASAARRTGWGWVRTGTCTRPPPDGTAIRNSPPGVTVKLRMSTEPKRRPVADAMTVEDSTPVADGPETGHRAHTHGADPQTCGCRWPRPTKALHPRGVLTGTCPVPLHGRTRSGTLTVNRAARVRRDPARLRRWRGRFSRQMPSAARRQRRMEAAPPPDRRTGQRTRVEQITQLHCHARPAPPHAGKGSPPQRLAVRIKGAPGGVLRGRRRRPSVNDCVIQVIGMPVTR